MQELNIFSSSIGEEMNQRFVKLDKGFVRIVLRSKFIVGRLGQFVPYLLRIWGTKLNRGFRLCKPKSAFCQVKQAVEAKSAFVRFKAIKWPNPDLGRGEK